MSEVGLIPTSNVNEIYLRKNQRVYFIAGDNCSSDSNSFSLNLEHQRPAFLCQKRNHKFNISKLFCSSGGGCVAPDPVNESYKEDEIDICYDLESYTGKASKIDGQKISDIGKGARELFFNGYYGNFVREDVSDDVVGKFLLNPNKDYSKKYSGSLGLLRPGKIKFLVVNNDNLDLLTLFQNENNYFRNIL